MSAERVSPDMLGLKPYFTPRLTLHSHWSSLIDDLHPSWNKASYVDLYEILDFVCKHCSIT